MNTEMLSPELQLNNMLEQINAQLPNNKAQKVSEIMNSVLGGEMLLRHVGFYKALGGLGDKISKTYNDITSGESGVVDAITNNIVPEGLQPLVRGATTALRGGGTAELEAAARTVAEPLVQSVVPEALQPIARGAATALTGGGTAELEAAARTAATPLVQAAGDAIPEALQPVARGAATALTGGGTAELEAAARTAATPLVQAAGDAIPEALQPVARGAATALTGGGTAELEQAVAPVVERTVAPAAQAVQRTIQPIAEEIEEQTPGLLDRFVTGVRNLGGRISSAVTGPRGLDDPAPSRDINLDDPTLNLTMGDPFSEGGPAIDMASRRGLFRLAPEVGQADSGQNIGNAFSQARATGELPNLPVFDGMREVPQSSAIQEQQAAANRAFNSDELPDVPTEQPPTQERPPAPEEPETPPVEQPTPATQDTQAASGEENIPATVAPEVEDDIANILPDLPDLAGGTAPAIAPTIAKVGGEIAETGFELGPLFEGAAILGAVVPQLVSLFEKPEAITQSYVGEQIGL
jgi:hypothetical protein